MPGSMDHSARHKVDAHVGVRDHRVGKPEHEGHGIQVPLQLLQGHHSAAEAVAEHHLNHDHQDEHEFAQLRK